MPDSRTLVKSVLDHPVYSTSAEGDQDFIEWIQEGLSQQPYDPLQNSIIKGIFVHVREQITSTLIDTNLINEFAAWEAASDEALMNFEKDLG